MTTSNTKIARVRSDRSLLRRVGGLFGALLLLAGAGRPAAADVTPVLISELLAKAETALSAYRLTTPPDDNAVLYADWVLKLDPANAGGRAILERAVEGYGDLVRRALQRAAAGDVRALAEAMTYRDRAKRVVDAYGLSDAGLSAMNAAIESRANAAEGPAGSALVKEAAVELVDRHLLLGERALDRGDLAEVRWNAAEARELIDRYGVGRDRQRRLGDLLAVADEARRLPRASAPADDLRIQAEEIVRQRIDLGHYALDQGDLAMAKRHQTAAESVMRVYHFSSPGYDRFAQRMADYRSGISYSANPFRIFGTF